MSDAETGSIAGLTASVLEEEAARQAEQEARDEEATFADDQLPGVADEEMTLREGLLKGGAWTFIVLTVLNSLDELEGAALNVLSPEIRDSFGISDGAIVFIAAAANSFFVLGAIPLGWLADRMRRGPIVGVCSAIFAAMVFLSGLAVNAFMLFWTRFGVGISKSNTIPVHGSLIADTYPIGIRGRLNATNAMFGRAMAAASPLLVGYIAAQAGGVEGWRWAYILLGIPVAIFALLAFTLPEPPRGQWEKKSVLHEVVDETEPPPVSIDAAFKRLLAIKTIRTVIMGFVALGFSLFTGGVLGNLYLEEEFGLDTVSRGWVGSLAGIGVIIVAPFVGSYYDKLYRRSPPLALFLVGALIMPVGIITPIQFLVPTVPAFTVLQILSAVLMSSAFATIGPLAQAIIPYRLRGLGIALITMYVFFVGATLGGVISFFFVNSFGPRTTMIVLAAPSLLIGGALIMSGSRTIRHDLSLVVAELREEQAEYERQRRDPESIPVVQVNHVDFSYGPVQVLFDVGFEVRRGEVLALLGTNGAGKSTILRVIAGLETPERGVVRLNGQTITFTSPEIRNQMGIHMLAGGNGVWASMSLRDNLRMGAFPYRHDADDVQRRIDRVLEIFPELAERLDTKAGDLSGGQQQMLALARTLLSDPEILLIDELSLGLAPVVVQRLLSVVEELADEGMTMIIVEQSLNVALAIADRAVFLEKGRVRFEGDAQELAERDDLARAVFFGTEGG